MPSFSRAMSMIRRFLAAWAISMSDLGFWCCEEGTGGIPSNEGGRRRCVGSHDPSGWGTTKKTSGKPGAGGEVDGGCRGAGFDLLAVGGLHPDELEAAVGADHGDAVGVDRGDLAHLAGDALRILRRQRLRIEDLQGLAVERGPGAGCRVAAANETVYLLPGPTPFDMRVIGSADA